MSEDFSSEITQEQSQGTSEAPSGNALQEATRNAEREIAEEQSQSGNQRQEKSVQELIDLDKLERFLWKGKPTTRKEFESGWLRQQDYTRKTQALKESQAKAEIETRKFQDNLDADLEKLRQNPSLI